MHIRMDAAKAIASSAAQLTTKPSDNSPVFLSDGSWTASIKSSKPGGPTYTVQLGSKFQPVLPDDTPMKPKGGTVPLDELTANSSMGPPYTVAISCTCPDFGYRGKSTSARYKSKKFNRGRLQRWPMLGCKHMIAVNEALTHEKLPAVYCNLEPNQAGIQNQVE